MAVSWTDAQLRAINERGRTILVSAAAGSGKTAVLVERVIHRILDEGCDIDKFLIVTFTRAAAAEMRARIAEAITKKLLEYPDDRHLRRQLTLLDRAMICTIDAFCARLLRENFRAAGISSDFRIADEGESSVIKAEILEDLIEEHYSAEDDGGFSTLVETFSDMRDDNGLQNVILETYEKIQSHPFPSRWLEKNIALAEESADLDPAQSIYGKYLIETMLRQTESVLMRCESIFDIFDAYGDIEECYGLSIHAEYDALVSFREKLTCGEWETIRAEYDLINFGRLKAYRGVNKDAVERVQNLRNSIKSTVSGMSKFLGVSTEKILEDSNAVLPCARTLFDLVTEFDERFTEEKNRRGIMDFNDMSHAAVRLLIASMGDDGMIEPSELAVTMSARFTEIMVDEYQDTNSIQDAIFRSLSRNEENLFMVGDVKQSIYRFRLADPSVFLNKYLSYSSEPAPGEPIRIVLSQNFRSRHAVLESVNYIFENIMTAELGDVDYKDHEELHYGSSYPGTDSPSECCFVETDGLDDTEAKKDRADAVYTARRIHELLNEPFQITEGDTTRDIRPDDIVILLRGTKNHASDYIRALEAENIPVFASLDDDLFDAPEISMLLSLLEVIDNPFEDIPLAALMRSAFYGFTPDELAEIRILSPKTGFYQAVEAYCGLENETARRCLRMIRDIKRYRRDALDMPSDRLIIKILEETGFESLIDIMYDGDDRRDNIRAFVELAGNYERAGYKGLYSFLNMVRGCRDNGQISKPTRPAVSAVRIMTIHKSKGLEFPVVFLSRAFGKFNLRDVTTPMLIHPNMGAGFKRRQIDRRIQYPTFPYRAIADAMRHESLSEEMRILYVAMTRAKEKLILVAAVNTSGDVLKKQVQNSALSPADPVILGAANAAMPWFCIPFARLPAATMILQDEGITRVAPEESDHSWELKAVSPVRLGADDEASEDETEAVLPFSEEELFSRLDFVYPYKESADSPSKVTATSLKGRYTDTEVSENAQPAHEHQHYFARPRFMMEAGLTPTERGTAQHLAMQLINYDRCRSVDEIRAQIDEMEKKALLSHEQAEAVNCRKIFAFFRSELGQRLMRSEKYMRESKFSLLVPSKPELTADDISRRPMPGEDTILFQGVVDCCFVEDGKLVIIDFKTDRVTKGEEQKTAEHYAPQLRSYSAALERIYGLPIKSAYLYLFSLDGFAEINL